MNITKYPDGTSYINEVALKCKPFKVNSYEDLWHLNQYVDAFISQHGIRPNIFIPNLIDSQADRRFNIGESSGLKLVLKFLNSLPVKKYFIFHPHNPEVVEAMLDSVEIIDNSMFINKVLSKIIPTGYGGEIWDGNKQENLVLISSDAGGFKPLMKLCDKIGWQGDTYSASKSRKYEDGKSKLVQVVDRQDFGGKDIMIVDDISVYGGTFKGLSKLLRERNCGKLYLAVSHMTVKNLGDDPVTNYFDKVFTTNSKFDSYYFEEDLYLQSDDEGNEYMKKEEVETLNLEIIKLF